MHVLHKVVLCFLCVEWNRAKLGVLVLGKEHIRLEQETRTPVLDCNTPLPQMDHIEI